MSTTLPSEASEDPDLASSAEQASRALTASIHSEEALFTPAFLRLLGMQAAYGFSFSMFFLLPKYLAASGASATHIGFVMGGFGVACVLTIPLLEPLVRKLGKRGALMAATLSLAVAGVAFAVIAPVGLGAVFLRASEGVTWTIMVSTATALTAEMAPKARLAQAIGIAGAASLVMNAIAPAIGEPLAERYGYRPVFLIAAFAALVAAGMAFRLHVTEGYAEEASPKAASQAPAAAIAETPPLRTYVVFAFAGLGFGSIFTFLAPFALTHGVRVISTFFVAYTIAALTLRLFGGRLSDRLGYRFVATVALGLYGLVLAATGIIGAHHLALLGIFIGVAHGAAFPALMAHLLQQTTPRRRPRVIGIANGAMSLGVSAVFPAGFLVSHLGYTATFAIAGTLVSAAAMLLRADSVV